MPVSRSDELAALKQDAVELADLPSLTAVSSVQGPDGVLRIMLPDREKQANVPIEGGRDVADRIAGAKFVELPGVASFPWAGDQRRSSRRPRRS
jgi:hypothetical protein